MSADATPPRINEIKNAPNLNIANISINDDHIVDYSRSGNDTHFGFYRDPDVEKGDMLGKQKNVIQKVQSRKMKMKNKGPDSNSKSIAKILENMKKIREE